MHTRPWRAMRAVSDPFMALTHSPRRTPSRLLFALLRGRRRRRLHDGREGTVIGLPRGL